DEPPRHLQTRARPDRLLRAGALAQDPAVDRGPGPGREEGGLPVGGHGAGDLQPVPHHVREDAERVYDDQNHPERDDLRVLAGSLAERLPPVRLPDHKRGSHHPLRKLKKDKKHTTKVPLCMITETIARAEEPPPFGSTKTPMYFGG